MNLISKDYLIELINSKYGLKFGTGFKIEPFHYNDTKGENEFHINKVDNIIYYGLINVEYLGRINVGFEGVNQLMEHGNYHSTSPFLFDNLFCGIAGECQVIGWKITLLDR